MLINPLDNRSLYSMYDWSMYMMQPYSDYCLNVSKRCKRIADTMNVPVTIPYLPETSQDVLKSFLDSNIKYFKELTGYFYISHMLTNIYEKPKFEIREIKLGADYCCIEEEVVDRKSFCDLLHFKKKGIKDNAYPKMLLVAPMSGHHATLLRDTVRSLLPYYDVYITDWKNARDVPLTDGSFDLDNFIEYVISYFQLLAPNLNVMAVCQPTVPVLAALALMSSAKDHKLPSSAVLVGGPIDTTKSPTTVNKLALSRGDDWFSHNVISMVPTRFPGGMRLVYPGFMQLSGFMSMNMQRHIESLHKAVQDYAEDKKEEALKTIQFYLEYFSTMDLTAEFYMQTINTVFQEQLLVHGHYLSRGREVRLQDIKGTSILVIEGEKDDITGLGQTKSVLSLCTNLPDTMKQYKLVSGVGHYGLFSGSKFRNLIVPEINQFTAAQHSSSVNGGGHVFKKTRS